jgi:very-short-patch-repair endonuclease
MKPHALPKDIDELQDKKFWNLATPLHVLVGSVSARKRDPSLHYHVSTGTFPYGSFVMMPSGIIVSSPELCFLQMAGELSFHDLMKLGYEFCGSFRVENKDSLRIEKPLTSVAKLSAYLDKAAGLYDRQNAMKALCFIIDGSASPMEAILTMILTLPYKYGGYGFPKPQLNYRIEVSEKVMNPKFKPTRRPIFYCDLYWPDKKTAVEYDSDERHFGALKIEKDAIRRNALESAGVRMITVSRRQLTDVTKMRVLSEVLSKLLGKRLVYKRKEFTSRNEALSRQLLPEESIDKYL